MALAWTLRGRLLITAALIALAQGAAAQIPTGLYVSAGIGANLATDSAVNVTGAARNLATSAELSYDPKPMGLLTLGYGFGNGVRMELETSLRYDSVDRGRGGPFGANATGGGDLINIGVMGNALLELDVGSPFIQPYLGFGLGYAWTNFENGQVNGNNLRLDIDGTDGNFAYQLIAGAAFPIAAVPGLAATLEYRYFATLDPQISGRVSNPGANNATAGRMEFDNEHHSILVGLRYAFGQQPQPIPAAPVFAAPAIAAPAIAPAPVTRSYIVYFASNSAALSTRARQILGEAAAAARGGSNTRIDVSGHTDTRGSATANQRLSERRAESVAAELRRQGIRREDIVVRGAGESELAVQTANNVREPQNRRVEIVLR
jgi:outer membrane protein OmpA-like peptidoglycan-associated protein